MNADSASYLGQNGSFQSFNLFFYCGNNPLLYVDKSGTDWESVIWTGIAGLGIIAMMAIPSGGISLCLGGAIFSTSSANAAAEATFYTGMAISGISASIETAETIISYSKTAKKSKKERATDKPSWVTSEDVDR